MLVDLQMLEPRPTVYTVLPLVLTAGRGYYGTFEDETHKRSLMPQVTELQDRGHQGHPPPKSTLLTRIYPLCIKMQSILNVKTCEA
jgi:hypothetical protein